MRTIMSELHRGVCVINLDPANDASTCDIDVRELIDLGEVMERLDLGPNGALLYCMDFLASHIDWLREKMQKRGPDYFLIDCPGQVELYTQHSALHDIIQTLTRDWGFQVCTVHLVDSHHCTDPGKFISVLLTSLSAMLHLETPHINVLSKIDMLKQYGELPFGLDYYLDVMDLTYLLDHVADDARSARYRDLSAALVELVEDFSLVCFHALDVSDKESMVALMLATDKAIGYINLAPEARDVNLLSAAFASLPEHLRDSQRARDRYGDDDDDEDE